MSDSATVTRDWSAGIEITKTTQFQAVFGNVWIATGATAPAKQIAGNAIPPGKAIVIQSGETVYFRTDEAIETLVSWVGVGV